MADRKDRKDSRPIPPPPGRAVPPGDPELEAASDDVTAEERRAATRAKREEFQAARKMLVDLHVEAARAGGVELDHLAFNDVRVDEFGDVIGEHGVRPWTAVQEENRSLRGVVAHEIAGRHRHVDPTDLGDVLDPGRPFDLDAVTAAADQIDAQRSEQARELLTSALAEVGIDTTAEGFDALAVLQRAAEPPKSTEGELPEGHHISTPQSRAASLPTGRPTDADQMLRSLADDGRTGTDAIEAAAAEDISKGKFW